MSDKYKDKYRIPSARLQTWDYSSNGSYFITICTKNREHYFGEIVNGEMQLNGIGKLTEQYWIAISKHFPFVDLGNFVVMPNHVHGILIINKAHNNGNVETPNLGVSTPTIKTKPKTGGKNEKWKSETLGVIINQYKRICTINVRKTHANFQWQSRFHDHIIRNTESYQRIQNYISDNPQNWKDDKFYC